jgi:hypothetical protein
MQMDDAAALKRAWEAKGSPPCEHPQLDKEYHLGAQTGDVVCMTCGESWWDADPNRPDRHR